MNKADYSAFGEVIGGGSGFQSVYQWQAQSGYREDGGSGQGDCGLVLMGARWYDPAIGRFTSRDSDLSQAPYAYCNGDPINFVDPTGYEGVSQADKWNTGHTAVFAGIALFAATVFFVFTVPIITGPILVYALAFGLGSGVLTGYGVNLIRAGNAKAPKEGKEGRDPREPVAPKYGPPTVAEISTMGPWQDQTNGKSTGQPYTGFPHYPVVQPQ